MTPHADPDLAYRHRMLRDRLTRPLRAVRRAVLVRRRLLAAVLTAVAVASGLHAAAAPPPPSVRVLTAARDLPAGTVLAGSDLAEEEFAPDSVPDGLASDAVGRTLAAPAAQRRAGDRRPPGRSRRWPTAIPS